MGMVGFGGEFIFWIMESHGGSRAQQKRGPVGKLSKRLVLSGDDEDDDIVSGVAPKEDISEGWPQEIDPGENELKKILDNNKV